VEIGNAAIVPGDVVVLKPGVVCCDMIVLASDRLVVDESALTGEANPVVKEAIDPLLSKQKYDPFRHKTYTLSAGTEILEISDEEGKNNDLGLVLGTGSFTSKGRLLSDVLAYQRHKLRFDDEVKIVLCILVLEAIFLVGMVFFFIDEDQWVYAWFYGTCVCACLCVCGDGRRRQFKWLVVVSPSLHRLMELFCAFPFVAAVFVLGTVIPPMLPSVFVVSVGISAKRLHEKRITCTNQEGILIAGKVNTAFFDKTGTL
jgi:magnesium-transporting ATPase (P-type)